MKYIVFRYSDPSSHTMRNLVEKPSISQTSIIFQKNECTENKGNSHLDSDVSVCFKAKAVSAVNLIGTHVFTQLRKEYCVTKHQKMVGV